MDIVRHCTTLYDIVRHFSALSDGGDSRTVSVSRVGGDLSCSSIEITGYRSPMMEVDSGEEGEEDGAEEDQG